MTTPKKEKKPKPKRVWMGNAYGKHRRECNVHNNLMFQAKWVNGKIICPHCGGYCFKRVYLNYYKEIMVPSLSKGKRCQSLHCHNCNGTFQVTIECHPNCEHRVDCLSGIVNIDFSKHLEKEATK